MNNAGNKLYNMLHKEAASDHPYKKDTVPLDVKGHTVYVKVAETQAQSEKGLAAYSELPNDCGMLFKQAAAFWMKDVEYPLDIVFMDKQGSVQEVQYMHKDKEGNTIYYPTKQAALALELPGGFCLRNNVRKGDTITVKER